MSGSCQHDDASVVFSGQMREEIGWESEARTSHTKLAQEAARVMRPIVKAGPRVRCG